MLLKPQPLADQIASLRAAAEADQAQAWWPTSLHALIAACFARLFAHLEQLVLLWHSGHLPQPPVRAPHPAPRTVSAGQCSPQHAPSAKLHQAARLSADEENQGQDFVFAAASRATEPPPKANGLWKNTDSYIFKVQGLGPSRGGALGTWWVPVGAASRRDGKALAFPILFVVGSVFTKIFCPRDCTY